MKYIFLDKIPQRNNDYTTKWANGAMGSISDRKANLIYRFHEDDKEDTLVSEMVIFEDDEDAPIVATGIVAYWLHYRRNDEDESAQSVLYKDVRQKSNVQHKGIRQIFKDYTEARLRKYKDEFDQKPISWLVDSEHNFYMHYIIPNEKKKIKQSEALFEYITPEEQELVREVMTEYIKYLEDCRDKQEPKAKLTGVLNTKLAREMFSKCIEKRWMCETENGYYWYGIPKCHGRIAQLSYLCGKIYCFKYDKINKNSGKEYPEEELDKLFGEKYLEKQLLQVYAATKPQKWRTLIDELFD